MTQSPPVMTLSANRYLYLLNIFCSKLQLSLDVITWACDTLFGIRCELSLGQPSPRYKSLCLPSDCSFTSNGLVKILQINDEAPPSSKRWPYHPLLRPKSCFGKKWLSQHLQDDRAFRFLLFLSITDFFNSELCIERRPTYFFVQLTLVYRNRIFQYPPKVDCLFKADCVVPYFYL